MLKDMRSEDIGLLIWACLFTVCIAVVVIAITVAILIGSYRHEVHCGANEAIAWNDATQNHDKCIQLYREIK